VQIVLRLIFGSSIPYIFESNWLGIGFAAFVAVIASLNLILDFDLLKMQQHNALLKHLNGYVQLLYLQLWCGCTIHSCVY
jgi:uncharacterized YccA/Bax inhibitor family protein